MLVWSEASAPETIYPNDINATVAEHLNEHDDLIARTTSIRDAKQGAND